MALAVALSIVAMVGRAFSQGTADRAAANKAIARVLEDQVAAWNKGDLEAFMSAYWKSPKLTFYSGKDKTQGWQATLDRYRKRYQADGREMGTLTFREIEIESLGPESAFVRGHWELKLQDETIGGLFTLILRRLSAEGWWIVHDHTSA